MPTENDGVKPDMTREQAMAIASKNINEMLYLSVRANRCRGQGCPITEAEDDALHILIDDMINFVSIGVMTWHNRKRGNTTTATGK